MDRARIRSILTLAAPVVGGMVSQNVVNLADTAMVGRLGAAAVAAVGVASFTNFMAVGAITGLGSAVQAMAARRVGEAQAGLAAVPLHAGLAVAWAVGLPLSFLLALTAPRWFGWLNDDPDVVRHAVPYLQARLAGMVFVGSNFAFRGFFNGVSRPDLYFRTLVSMHVVNIATSWVLIYGWGPIPALGALGAGIGSSVSAVFGTAVYVQAGLGATRPFGFFQAAPTIDGVRTLVRLAVPGSLQQLLFAAGFTALFVIVGTIGTDEVAGANVLVNLTMVAVLPGLGLGIAAASLVGQALGRGEPDDARAWGWETAAVGAVALGLLGVPMWVAPEALLGFFLPDAPRAVEVAAWPLRLVGATLAVEAVGLVLMNGLFGAGAARTSALISVGLQWGVGLPLAWLLGPRLGYGLLGVWVATIAQRVVQVALFVAAWRGDGWTRARA